MLRETGACVRRAAVGSGCDPHKRQCYGAWRCGNATIQRSARSLLGFNSESRAFGGLCEVCVVELDGIDSLLVGISRARYTRSRKV